MTAVEQAALLGLKVGDVSPDGQEVRRRVTLDPATTKGGRKGEVFLPARLIPKLREFLSCKRSNGQALDADAPLFVSTQRRRLSPRAAQWRFAWWQRRAGFDRMYILPLAAPLGGHKRLQSDPGSVPRAEVRPARIAAHHCHLHPPGG